MDGERVDHDAFWPMKQYKRITPKEWGDLLNEIKALKDRIDKLEKQKNEKAR
jgi:hypothetical protein